MYNVCVHQCTLAVEYISVVLSGMGVLSGGWFLHRIGISIIHATLCFVRGSTNHHTNLGFASVCIRFIFPAQNKGWHVLYPLSIFFHIHRGFRLHCILIVTKNRVTCEKIKEKHNGKKSYEIHRSLTANLVIIMSEQSMQVIVVNEAKGGCKQQKKRKTPRPP